MKDVWNDGLNIKFHLSHYLITMSNMFVEGLSGLCLIVPGIFASLSLIILSPAYKYMDIGSEETIQLGIKGLTSIPNKILQSILLMILSPIGYFVVLINNKKQKKVKKKKKEKVVPTNFFDVPIVS